MNRKILLLFLLSFFFTLSHLSGQEIKQGKKTASSAKNLKESDCFMEFGVRYGSTLYHPKSAIYLKDLYFGSLEVRFGKQSSGKAQWEQMLNFPVYGVALRYTDYTDFFDTKSENRERNKVIGKNIALFGYLQGAIVRYRCFAWHYQIGMGAVYFTKIYKKENVYQPETLTPDPNNPDRYINQGENTDADIGESLEYPSNNLISLYLTPYINFQMGFDFRVSRQIDLCFNANFCHASNANINMPNFGINEVQGIASVRYHFNPEHKIEKKNNFPKFEAKNALFFTVDPGFLYARYDDNYYFKTGISVGYARQVLPILNVGASFEVCYARYLAHSWDYNYTEWEREGSPRVKMPHNIHSEAFYGFAELAFSRFALQVGIGAYVNKGPGQAKNMDLAQNWNNGGTLTKYPVVYEKVGFRIYLGKEYHHFVGASIRAHAPVADYLAFTYGYKFYRFSDIKRHKNEK
ncbi:MAG: hypothetical protein LBR51_06195 [Bacteroidales bacterium]|jgi:hypothetical protein|nr:hypothetical protein [Bacteroidales bacterium]